MCYAYGQGQSGPTPETHAPFEAWLISREGAGPRWCGRGHNPGAGLSKRLSLHLFIGAGSHTSGSRPHFSWAFLGRWLVSVMKTTLSVGWWN